MRKLERTKPKYFHIHKDGQSFASMQFLTHAEIVVTVLSALMPDHNWEIFDATPELTPEKKAAINKLRAEIAELDRSLNP